VSLKAEERGGSGRRRGDGGGGRSRSRRSTMKDEPTPTIMLRCDLRREKMR